MKRGDPLRAWVDWPIALPPSEMERFQQQYQVRNLGARNIGNLIETKGGANLKELAVNQLTQWLAIKQQSRDEIYTGYGVPPSIVSVIEAGNLGGGTGSSQARMFNVNTCGPIAELVMEKFSFHLLYQAYGVKDWHLSFGTVDWRDDMVIDQIADLRVRNGRWTINKARSVIGEPPIDGGDHPFIVDRAAMVLYEDLDAFSKASVAAIHQKGQPLEQTIQPPPPISTVSDPQGNPLFGQKGSGSAESEDDSFFYSRGLWGPDQEDKVLEAAWRKHYQEIRKEVLEELSQEDKDTKE
jgi:hypothetical protein